MLHRGDGNGDGPTVAPLAPEGIATLIAMVRRLEPDFVLFEGVMVLAALIALRAEFPALRLIVDMHNVESALDLANACARYPAPLRPLVRHARRRRLEAARAAERRAGGLADALWACSEEDARALRGLGIRAPVHVVANPVPSWALDMLATTWTPRGQDLLFVGHLGYGPNKRAVAELCRVILPALTRLRPDTRLHVCGRAPGARLARMVAAHGHKLTADPADLRPAYARAAAAVMPLREGGGTRLKALEALAAGCPVVATAKAVEGLGLVPGHHYLAAEHPKDFVAALLRLDAEDGLAHALAAEGRRLIAARYAGIPRRQALRRAIGLPVTELPASWDDIE